MNINCVSSVSFGYKNILKTQWLKGNMPSVQKGFYGDVLTKRNVTLEHLKPHSKGGATALHNLVLASDAKNFERSNYPLKDFINLDAMEEYLQQFEEIKLKDFNGKEYIKAIRKTVSRLIGEGK